MKRIASLLLAVTFSIFSFAGCTPKKEPVIESLPDQLVPPEEINEDDPWFYSSLQDLSNVHDSGEYDFITNKYLGSDEEGILILTIANKNWDGLDYKNYNSIDYQFGFIDYYTFDGELINSFAINDTYQDNRNRFHLSTINTDEQFVIEDGQIVVRLSAFPVSAYDPYKVLEMSVDYRNGTHSEWEEVDETVPMEVLKVDNKLTFENRYVWGDYSAEVYVNDFTYDDCSCYIVVNKPDGSSFSVNSRDKLPDSNIYNITNMWKISDRYLMCCYDNWYSFEYFFIDLDTKDMFDPNDRFEFLKNVQIDKITPVEGYGAFLVDSEVGISRIDFDNESIEIYLTYNQCNINRAEIKRMNIVAASDDSVTFAGEVFVPGLTNYDAFKVVKLTRSESNPNVDKNILTLCSLEEIDYATYESIYRFNETSNSSFIFIDNRYTLTYDEMKDSQKVADMCNQICVDIFAGEGPDILLNMEMATELDSGDYLIDLSSLVTGEEYFGNIIEACCQNDGGLYQLPLIVEIAGILTEEYNISPDQIGFTYEEYKDFVSTICNGRDPIKLSRDEYFKYLYAAMSDSFVSGLECNYDGPEFKALAEYMNTNYYVQVDSDENSEIIQPTDTQFMNLYSVNWYIDCLGDKATEMKFIGVPTFDGRSPQFYMNKSVAVSSETADIDGCMDFIKILLSSDIQNLSVEGFHSIPVNKQLVKTVGTNALKLHNEQVEQNLNMSSKEELLQLGLDITYLDESVIDYYISIIESCNTYASQDASIIVIATEEIQPYLEGQKSLSEVIDIMTNRVELLLEERKG